jgi:hypothetical protein
MDDIVNTWCRMWNDDPSLAGSVATEDVRVWFGGAGSPGVEGGAELEAFVGRYRAERGVRFTPLTVAVDDGGERLAYTWEALFPDGTERGGIDLCTIRDRRIAENWSVVGERAHDLTPRTPDSGQADLAEICAAWPRLWNGELEAPKLVDAGFRIWFGAAEPLDGAGAFAAFVDAHRAAHPARRYANYRAPVIDTARQLAAMTWTATLGGEVLGGIDLLQCTGDALSRVWSVTGAKGF